MPTSVPNPVAYPDQGYGYEVTALDVRIAYSHTLTTAGNAGVDGAAGPASVPSSAIRPLAADSSPALSGRKRAWTDPFATSRADRR